MDFSLSEEQKFLESSTRSLAADLFGEPVARAALDGDRTKADHGWAALQASGLTSLLIAEEHGGGGGTLLDACIVATELSSALAPVPYLTSAVAAPLLLGTVPAGDAAPLLEKLSAGLTCGVLVDRSLRWPAVSGELICLDWQPDRPGLFVDSGHAELVDDFEPATNVDPLHPVGKATGGLRASGDTQLSEDARRALAGVRVASAAALTGCLAGAAQLAWDYVAIREQYGSPIASFQAVRHMAADLLVDLETCKSVSLGAAWQVENEDLVEAERVAAIAKAWCGQAAIRSVETSIQLLGGIGVTWESTAHLYLRNAHMFAASFGDTRTLLRGVGAEFVELRGRESHGPA